MNTLPINDGRASMLSTALGILINASFRLQERTNLEAAPLSPEIEKALGDTDDRRCLIDAFDEALEIACEARNAYAKSHEMGVDGVTIGYAAPGAADMAKASE